jgi:3-isopropylmalate dehydrogenase
MMLRFSCAQEAAATTIEAAVRRVITDGLRTADIHTPGTNRVGTVAMGEAIAAVI